MINSTKKKKEENLKAADVFSSWYKETGIAGKKKKEL